MDWVAASNLAAIAVSPVVAVVVSVWLQDRSERRRTRMRIFADLLANRHRPVCEENLRALHQIDVVFAREPKVRSLWHRYYDLLGSPEGLNEIGYRKREQTYRDMLTAMAHALGFAAEVASGDIERVYNPVAVGEQERLQRDTQIEFLRVLRSSESFSQPRTSADVELEAKPHGAVSQAGRTP